MFPPPVYTAVWLPGTQLWWPAKYPEDIRTDRLDVTAALEDDDTIVSAEAAVAASGSGEMQPSDLIVSGFILTLTEADGQPTRVYQTRFIVNLASGLVRVFEVRRGVLADLPTDQPQIAPDPGFGEAVTWTVGTGPSLNFSIASNSMYSLLIPGF